MRVVLGALVAASLFAGGGSQDIAPEQSEFTPFAERAYRLINSVAFEFDDQAMYVALLYPEVLEHRGEAAEGAPEIALFSTRRVAGGWSEPELMPFSGTYPDYEPTANRQGQMVFNSKRPYPDGRVPELNDLYLVERVAGGTWSQPRSIEAINTYENEESYGSLMADGTLVFLRGRPGPSGEPAYDLYWSRFVDGVYQEPTRHPVSTDRFGEGDPWVAPDGSYIFFTRWDDDIGWAESVDLYVAFQTGGVWSEPVALDQLNTEGADFGVAISPDSRWLYYKTGSQFHRRLLQPVLREARARTLGSANAR